MPKPVTSRSNITSTHGSDALIWMKNLQRWPSGFIHLLEMARLHSINFRLFSMRHFNTIVVAEILIKIRILEPIYPCNYSLLSIGVDILTIFKPNIKTNILIIVSFHFHILYLYYYNTYFSNTKKFTTIIYSAIHINAQVVSMSLAESCLTVFFTLFAWVVGAKS